MEISHFRPHKGWANEITSRVWDATIERGDFAARLEDRWPEVIDDDDFRDLCLSVLGSRPPAPPDMGARADEIDWKELRLAWAKRLHKDVPDPDAPSDFFSRQPPRPTHKSIRPSTAKRFLLDRLLGGVQCSSAAYQVRALDLDGGLGWSDVAFLLSCDGEDVAVWHPGVKLFALIVRDSLSRRGFVIASAALEAFRSDMRVRPLQGRRIARCLVREQETGVEARVERMFWAWLDDGSCESRTYFDLRRAEEAFALCVSSPRDFAQAMSASSVPADEEEAAG